MILFYVIFISNQYSPELRQALIDTLFNILFLLPYRIIKFDHDSLIQ